jgi:hypothetical protein
MKKAAETSFSEFKCRDPFAPASRMDLNLVIQAREDHIDDMLVAGSAHQQRNLVGAAEPAVAGGVDRKQHIAAR